MLHLLNHRKFYRIALIHVVRRPLLQLLQFRVLFRSQASAEILLVYQLYTTLVLSIKYLLRLIILLYQPGVLFQQARADVGGCIAEGARVKLLRHSPSLIQIVT